ncbi:RDD family protein, partial [Caulobacter sp. 17J65-9]|uniref:RDD family protein n=1 Tax=Caulobacter sp. 17J65-9 TaxID=2709382 RepID=UPI0013C6235F
MTDDSARPVWAGFWRRLFAFILDTLILGAIGAAVTLPVFDLMATIEGPLRLAGGAVALLYFTWFSSGAGGAATPGMRLFGLKVVNLRGRPIGLVRSLWRALVLQAPLTLNGTHLILDDPLAAQIFTVTASTLVFGVTLAQIVLLLFNHPSRRLAHDLVSGAAVVRRHAEGAVPAARSAAPLFAWLFVGLGLAGGVWMVLRPNVLVGLAPNVGPLSAAATAVNALPEAMDAQVGENTTTYWGDEGKTTTHTLVITARLKARPKDQEAEVERVAEAALSAYELAPGQQVMVVLKRGYDVGLWSSWISYQAPYQPAARPAATPEATPEIEADAQAVVAQAEADASAASARAEPPRPVEPVVMKLEPVVVPPVPAPDAAQPAPA